MRSIQQNNTAEKNYQPKTVSGLKTYKLNIHD